MKRSTYSGTIRPVGTLPCVEAFVALLLLLAAVAAAMARRVVALFGENLSRRRLEELGHHALSLGPNRADLTEREEKTAIAIASNEPFSGWTKTFTDPRLCAAIVDRLTYDATIIETGTTSYRLAHTRAGGANSNRHGGAKSS